MTVSVETEEVERFRDLVRERLGLVFDDSRTGQLQSVLESRLSETRRPAASYLALLSAGQLAPAEAAALASELTVTETYFFRDRNQFRAFREVVLPARVDAAPGPRCLRVLSAGCASGEEAYSLAIALTESLAARPGWTFRVTGLDLNPRVLEKARSGRYGSWSLRDVADEVRDRWFRTSRGEYLVDERVRSAVVFAERNLTDPGALVPDSSVDVAFCRNVLMYFHAGAAAAVVERIARALAPGGFLFLGHAENLRGISHAFRLCHTHETFYYQKRDGAAEPPEPRPPSGAWAPVPEAAALATLVEEADSWVDAVRRASQRIADLGAQAGSPGPFRPSAASAERARALELMKAERLGEALSVVDALDEAEAAEPESLILRAALLTARGDVEAAESVCLRLLAADELRPGAHYLLALCREAGHDLEGALEHDEVATYLDPGFAMPRLHMGLLSRRRGDLARARRDLDQARALLEREESARLLLFGGGFGREALLSLCRAERERCGGAS